MNSGRGGVKHPTLQPSSGLFQIAVLVCPDAGVQIELSKVVTHRQRQWGFLAERALSYSCFIKSLSKRKFVQKRDKLLYSMDFKNRQKTTTALTGSGYDPKYD